MAEPGRIRELPVAGLVRGPSELEPWPSLSRIVGAEIWAKRDDLLPLGLGGNKIRKLDLILGRALRDGVDTVITHGGVQSNHCRLTAAAAARLGMRCILVLHGEPAEPTGNLLLDLLFGARLDFVPDSDAARIRMQELAERARDDGRTPLVVPLGGSNALGSAAYLLAAEELGRQCEDQGLAPAAVYATLGSGGTVAGIAAGVSRCLPQSRTVAVNIAALSPHGRDVPVPALAAEAAAELGLDEAPVDYEIEDGFAGEGYGIATPECLDALRLLASSEGVLLDPTYTAKTMAALIHAARGGAEGPLVFWHTGGAASLFARDPRELLGRPADGA